MTQNLGITDEVLLTGRVASGDITDDAELRKELEKIYPTENWSDINRLMKAMKTRATRQSGGTTEVVDGEVVHTMGDVPADPQGRTHGQDVSVQVGTDSDGNPIMQNYAYYAGNPSLGIEGGVVDIPVTFPSIIVNLRLLIIVLVVFTETICFPMTSFTSAKIVGSLKFKVSFTL